MKNQELKDELELLLDAFYQKAKNNRTVLTLFPSNLKQIVKEAEKFISTGELSSDVVDDLPCDPSVVAVVFTKWFDDVKSIAKKTFLRIDKAKHHEYDLDLVKKYNSVTLPVSKSNLRLESCIFSRFCKNLTSFSNEEIFIDKALDSILTDNEILKTSSVWQDSLDNSCLEIKHLPKPEFLAQYILSLYISSTPDYGNLLTQYFEVDPGEYSDIQAGYIYFNLGDLQIDQWGDVLTDIHNCKPMLDDVKDGAKIIGVLKDLYGENYRLYNLPIRLKIKTSIILEEADTRHFPGALGFANMVFDRELDGSWKQVHANKKLWDEQLKESGLKTSDFVKIISNAIFHFTLKDLHHDN